MHGVRQPPGSTWTAAQARVPMAGPCIGSLGADGLVYLFVGFTGATGYVYEPAADRFKPMPIAGVPIAAPGASVTGADGRIYVIGGAAGGPVAAYTPSTQSWNAVAPFNAVHNNRAAATLGADGRIYLIGGQVSGNGGLNTAVWSAAAEAYGPTIATMPPSAPAGSSVAITGSNFAAGATVRLYFDNMSGAALSTGHTDANGAIVATIPLTIPAGTSATAHRVIAVDDRSQYPVNAVLTVTP